MAKLVQFMFTHDPSQRVPEVARELLRDFFILKEQGYPVADTVILFGGPEHVRNLIAAEMLRQLDSQSRVSVSVKTRPEVTSPSPMGYSIDLEYVLGAAR